MRQNRPSDDRVRELFNYDPVTGVFLWKKKPAKNCRVSVGSVAGSRRHIHGRDVLYIKFDGFSFTAQQIAFFLANGRWATGRVSPSNGDAMDLRASNLVELSAASIDHDRSTKDGQRIYSADMKYQRDYGISYSEYAKMSDAQNGVCASCKCPETMIRKGVVQWLSVDHDHKTGAVRGLLCHACNYGLGAFGDDPAKLRAAADYLERHKQLSEAPLPDNVVKLKGGK